jgi:hypothetical protein
VTISELVVALQEHRQQHGDVEVRVHCHGCCEHAHTIDGMALGGTRDQADEATILVIEV